MATALIGHERPWREWREALSGRRLPHGWILAGMRGTGKGAFALAAARELVAEPGMPQPAGDHPDIFRLEREPSPDEEKKRAQGKPYQLRRNITVDQVRTMQRRLTTRPTLGSRRAIIIDPADDLEGGAANALLKSLEEAPAGTYFLLVAHRLGRLLPTIRSRCRILRFPALGPGEIDALLQRAVPEADDAARAAAIAASGGSPGAALDFLTLELGTMHRLMSEIVRHGDRDFTHRGRLAETMGGRRDLQRQAAAIDLARAVTMREMHHAPVAALPLLADTHADLVRLGTEAPAYNYDPGLLMMEIGTLLARLAAPR